MPAPPFPVVRNVIRAMYTDLGYEIENDNLLEIIVPKRKWPMTRRKKYCRCLAKNS